MNIGVRCEGNEVKVDMYDIDMQSYIIQMTVIVAMSKSRIRSFVFTMS